MIIRTLEGKLGKVTLKLNFEYKEKGKEIYLFESNAVDANTSQKLFIDTWHCSDKNEANTKLQNLVHDYISQGYQETTPVDKNVSEDVEKTSFLSKVLRKIW